MKGLKYLIFPIIMFLTFSNIVVAKTCTYENGNFVYVCNITTSNVKCEFDGNNPNKVEYVKINKDNNNITKEASTFQEINNLTSQNFLNSNNEINCNKVKTIYIDYNVTNSGAFQIYNVSTQKTSLNNEVYDKVSYLYQGNSNYSLNVQKSDTLDSSNVNNTNDNSNQSTSNEINSNNDEKFSVDNFCSSKVQGVFTTIGWIFYILKILIPILLIVFGSIDLGKAVVASKDDEIKKATKTLIMRAIAGIVIFFVPTIIGFAVKLIGGEEIYDENNGTFARCTYCMLHPNECKKLINEE